MKINKNSIKISPSDKNISNGDVKMILKKQLQIYFEKIKSKEITVTDAEVGLGCSRTWLSILYNRYKKGLPIEKDLKQVLLARF